MPILPMTASDGPAAADEEPGADMVSGAVADAGGGGRRQTTNSVTPFCGPATMLPSQAAVCASAVCARVDQ